MLKNKAFKYRIYPDEAQTELLAKTFGCVRFVYNKMLADKIAYYNETQKTLNNTPAQYKKEFQFLREVDSLALCNAQLNLQTAYKNFFTRKESGFPKFKKKKGEAAYTTNFVNGNISISGDALKLPKLGFVKIKLHRQLPKDAAIKSVTVRRTATNKYFASILVEYEKDAPRLADISDETAIGLDYSSPCFYVDSEGNVANYDHYYRKSEKKLAKEQHRLAKKRKGSKNREKQGRKVARVHEKIANQRLDFLHKQSTSIAKRYNVVCVEDINLRGMAGSLRLGKATNDNGFGKFRELLKYKLEDQGKHFVVIDKWYPSSKTCRHCNHVHKELKLSDRVYSCPGCGSLILRDPNSAINIKKEGLRILKSA